MKKITHVKRILTAMLCMIMMLSVLPTSVFAAKEMFTTYQIDDVTITGIDAPVAGKPFDFTAEEASQKYNVIKVAWKSQYGSNYITSTSESATAGTKYTVYVVLEVATANHYFNTDSSRRPAVSSVTVNGNTANANNAMDYSLFSVDASKYEHDTTYQKYLTVMYTFPEVESAPIESIEFVVPAPVPGERVPTTFQASGISIDSINGNANNGQIGVTKVEWSLQDGTSLAGNATFEYGKKYTLMLTLTVNYGASFATDANHFLAQPGKPFPKVTVKMNGNTATVLPTYDSYSNLYVVAACVFDCDTAAKIEKIELTDIDVPVAGKAPDYNFICGVGYENNGRNDAYYKNGMCWSEVGSSYIVCDGTHAFLPGKVYQVDIRIKAKDGYEFATNSYGNVSMTATVNGKSATISGNKNEILVTYVFPATGSVAIGKVGVTDVDAPATGNIPDYDITYTNVNYGAANYNNATTKNGISWYNETDKKIMSTSDKFEAGKTYTVQVTIWASNGYEFQYKSGSVNVTATVNGIGAEVTSRNSEEVILYYTFPKTEVHKCSPLKVDEVKASCKETGKKAYYFCPECGKNFEDSKCTKQITDIYAWGAIAKLEHTGGKATCDNRAICKNCGEYYGELAEHNFGSAWDYKDEKGHAHKCKVCGIQDTVIPHSGGTAKCGETAKCAECKAEYGEVKQHQWSTKWDYTDKNGHAHKCTACGEHDTVQAHTGGTADCKNKAKCSACSTEYGKTGDHKWSTQWNYTDTKGHAHKCTVCGEHDDIVKHTPGTAATETTPQSCTVCNYIIEPAKKHEHKLTKVAAVDADCTTAGKKQHYVCDGCSKLFSDSKGKNEIIDSDSILIPATGHKEKWQSDADTHWKECTVKKCGAVTTEKEAHEFNKAGKCTVCSYKSDKKTESPQTTDPAEEQDTSIPDNSDVTVNPDITDTPDVTGTPGEDTAPTPDTTDTNALGENGENNPVMWIAVIASGIIAVVCVITMVVVLAKRNKKNE
ncbi:MAG: hypothetical protein IJA67_14095 [Oscillospiraceae bacterium]|nr:hypothetical protein [Oscillospiraceae bacterium]